MHQTSISDNWHTELPDFVSAPLVVARAHGCDVFGLCPPDSINEIRKLQETAEEDLLGTRDLIRQLELGE